MQEIRIDAGKPRRAASEMRERLAKDAQRAAQVAAFMVAERDGNLDKSLQQMTLPPNARPPGVLPVFVGLKVFAALVAGQARCQRSGGPVNRQTNSPRCSVLPSYRTKRQSKARNGKAKRPRPRPRALCGFVQRRRHRRVRCMQCLSTCRPCRRRDRRPGPQPWARESPRSGLRWSAAGRRWRPRSAVRCGSPWSDR